MFSRKRSPEETCGRPVALSDEFRLSTFANAGRSEKNDISGHALNLFHQLGIIIAVQFQFGINIQEGIADDTYDDQQTSRRNQENGSGRQCCSNTDSFQEQVDEISQEQQPDPGTAHREA